MKLEEASIRAALDTLRATMDERACVADLNYHILGVTEDGLLEQASCVLERCAAGEPLETAAAAFSGYITLFRTDEGPMGYLLVFGQRPQLTAAYLNTLLLLQKSIQERSRQELCREKRRLLTNQLASSDHIDSEAASYFHLLELSIHTSRCAVLFGCLPGGEGIKSGESVGAVLEEWARSSNAVGKEDIYGQLNSGYFLLFKAQSGQIGRQERRRSVEETVADAAAYLTGRGCEGKLLACVGSGYTQAAQLRESFLEASYLQMNQEYLAPAEAVCLFIEDYVFEYLYSRLDPALQDTLTRDLRCALESRPQIAGTAMALAQNDTSPLRTAKAQGLHRNTIQQRLQKIQTEVGLDPLYAIQDRAALRAYALQKTRKTIWNAGFIVQPGSVLHQGLQRLSDLVYQGSGGSFRINVHTISTSGDNFQLFSMLQTGALDAVLGSTIALEPATKGRISVLMLPFLFSSDEEAEYVLEKTVVPDLERDLSEANMICPCIWSMGWRYLTSRGTPIRVPGDLAGRRVRILASRVEEQYFSSLGATPVQIYYNAIRAALASGIIDCQENPYTNILAMNFYQYQDYITELPLWLSPEALCFSKRSWDALEEDKRELLAAGVRETTYWIYQRQREMNQEAKAELLRRKIRIVVPDARERALWENTAGALYGEKQYQEILGKIQGAKKQYAKKRN